MIKMIINGRSPTMKHVSRTHRVALDWFFDKRNLALKFEMKDVDTRCQLADMLTNSGNYLSRMEPSFEIVQHHGHVCVFPQPCELSNCLFSALSKWQMEDEQEGEDYNHEEEDTNRVVTKS